MNRRKDNGSTLTKFFRSFMHGVDGIVYAIEKEINILIIMILGIITFMVAYLLEISTVELCIVVLSMGAMMALELVNCAFEAVVDLVTLETNELAKVCKDCANAASLVLVVVNMFVLGIIFIPKIIELL